MSTITKPRPKPQQPAQPRKSEENLTQFAERLWERRRKEFMREIHADSKRLPKTPK